MTTSWILWNPEDWGWSDGGEVLRHRTNESKVGESGREEMTSKERAEKFFSGNLGDRIPDWYRLELEKEFERALDEVEERGRSACENTHVIKTVENLYMKGQREMQERVAKEIATIGKEKHPYRRSGPYLISRIRALPIEGE